MHSELSKLYYTYTCSYIPGFTDLSQTQRSVCSRHRPRVFVAYVNLINIPLSRLLDLVWLTDSRGKRQSLLDVSAPSPSRFVSLLFHAGQGAFSLFIWACLKRTVVLQKRLSAASEFLMGPNHEQHPLHEMELVYLQLPSSHCICSVLKSVLNNDLWPPRVKVNTFPHNNWKHDASGHCGLCSRGMKN